MPAYNNIPLKVSLYIRLLRNELGLSNKELYERFPNYAKRSIARHAKLPVDDHKIDKRKDNPNMGRPKRCTERDRRKLFSTIQSLRRNGEPVFTSVTVQEEAGIEEGRVSNRTIRRELDAQDFGYRQCRKKGKCRS